MNRTIILLVFIVVTPVAFFVAYQVDKMNDISRPAVTERNQSAIVFKPTVKSQASATKEATVADASKETATTTEKRTSDSAREFARARNATRLRELLLQSTLPATFRSIDESAVERFEELLFQTLEQQRVTDSLNAKWQADGWSIENWKVRGREYLLIHESENQLRGRGFFAVQLKTESTIVLQAPHRFFDMGTGTITRELVSKHDVLAAAWNTIHRREYDLAHQKNHFINAFSRALVRYRQQSQFVQIHGFDRHSQTGRAATAAMIVSDSTKFPGRVARETALNMKEHFGESEALLYQVEVTVLGGTKNEQAHVVRDAGSNRFLHIEMSKETRDRLKKSAKDRAAFFESLAVRP